MAKLNQTLANASAKKDWMKSIRGEQALCIQTIRSILLRGRRTCACGDAPHPAPRRPMWRQHKTKSYLLKVASTEGTKIHQKGEKHIGRVPRVIGNMHRYHMYKESVFLGKLFVSLPVQCSMCCSLFLFSGFILCICFVFWLW